MNPATTREGAHPAPRTPAPDERRRRGRLHVFLGACPGVGKTRAMLGAARLRCAQGTDVVVGTAETHGCPELAALLHGLRAIPRGSAGAGALDIAAILARKPDTIVIDELARANPAGARHAKRCQDVEELLDAGIDVLTTLNVHEVESRADAARQITGMAPGETIPDSLLERAHEIHLVEITAEARRTRAASLTEGDANGARAIWFEPAPFAALRAMTLRVVAEHLDRLLRQWRDADPGRTIRPAGERFLVAVGPSPFSTQLVRWTRRMAAAQGAAWVAVCVESSRRLGPEAQRRLERNLSLARELGAEIVVTHDDNVAAALVRVARQQNATRIVIGKSRAPWLLDWLRGGSFAERLLRRSVAIDVCVVPAQPVAGPADGWLKREPPERASWREFAEVLLVLAILSIASWFAAGYVGHLAVGLLYLLATIALSLRVGRWPVLVAGVASALGWNFLFIPPSFTFRIEKFEDGMMFAMYFVVALIAGQMTARIRRQERHERAREERATALFRLTRALTGARSLDEAVSVALNHADDCFGAATAVLLATPEGTLASHPASSLELSLAEREVATWAWRNRRKAGRFTDTLAGADAFHVPLLREDAALGVLVIRPRAQTELTFAQRDLAESFAAQLALLVESEQFRAAAEREKLLAESEKLHRVLLDGVSHELNTPLAVLRAAAEGLRDSPGATRDQLTEEILTATRRLQRLVNNLLDQTRLESGALRPRLDWCEAHDLVNAAHDGIEDLLVDHPLEISIPADMPLIRADFALMEQVIANLLLNAALHTPAGTPVFLASGLETETNRLFFTVADRGPGLPPGMRDRLFRKFQRRDAAQVGGLGLGLSIIHGFVAAQGGEVVAGENPGGGAVFTVYLPHVPHGNIPDE